MSILQQVIRIAILRRFSNYLKMLKKCLLLVNENSAVFGFNLKIGNRVKVACAFYNFGHSIQSFFEKQTTGNDGKDL